MRYLVRLEADVPSDLEPEALERLNAAETDRGVALLRAGVIEHLWRVAGRRANVGIWNAASPEELRAIVGDLPMAAYLRIESIEELHEHPVAAATRSKPSLKEAHHGATR